jgi:hypothetical protein
MGIHYSYKNERPQKAMEKKARREKKLAEKRAKRQAKLGKKIEPEVDKMHDINKIITLSDITDPDKT